MFLWCQGGSPAQSTGHDPLQKLHPHPCPAGLCEYCTTSILGSLCLKQVPQILWLQDSNLMFASLLLYETQCNTIHNNTLHHSQLSLFLAVPKLEGFWGPAPCCTPLQCCCGWRPSLLVIVSLVFKPHKVTYLTKIGN